MTFPAITLTNLTATGDVVTGPGAVTTMFKGLPAACIGDAIAGAACTGTITGSLRPNVVCKGRPLACTGSPVTGVNPVTGVPVATVCAVTPNVNDLA